MSAASHTQCRLERKDGEVTHSMVAWIDARHATIGNQVTPEDHEGAWTVMETYHTRTDVTDRAHDHTRFQWKLEGKKDKKKRDLP